MKIINPTNKPPAALQHAVKQATERLALARLTQAGALSARDLALMAMRKRPAGVAALLVDLSAKG